MARQVFFSRMIAGRTFQGVLTEGGPHLEIQRSRFDRETVPLGDGCLVAETFGDKRAKALWICAEDMQQPKFSLARFNFAEIQDFLQGFGPRVAGSDRGHAFFSSDAWQALKDYAAIHPRKAASFDPQGGGLEGWSVRALTENAEKASEDEAPHSARGM